MCGTLATRKVRLITWRGTVDMDGSADAPPTEVAATVVPFFCFFFRVFFEGAYYLLICPRHPQFPKYTYLENRGCNYV